MPEDLPHRMPDRMPEDMSDSMPEDMPDRMPEDLPDRMPEDMPEDMPDRMPEDMSDRMPEDLPVRKCIHVMVGITRSKVIIIFIVLQLWWNYFEGHVSMWEILVWWNKFAMAVPKDPRSLQYVALQYIALPVSHAETVDQAQGGEECWQENEHGHKTEREHDSMPSPLLQLSRNHWQPQLVDPFPGRTWHWITLVGCKWMQ